MVCAVCKTDAPDMEHKFGEGAPFSPWRRWSIFAPLYFKSNDDNTAAIEGYCSPKCASLALAPLSYQ